MWRGGSSGAEQLVERGHQLEDARAAVSAEIEHLPVGLRRGEREQIALNHVVNVSEIARLQAVAGDRRALIVQHQREQAWNHGCVR